jgi:hypothetical protein
MGRRDETAVYRIFPSIRLIQPASVTALSLRFCPRQWLHRKALDFMMKSYSKANHKPNLLGSSVYAFKLPQVGGILPFDESERREDGERCEDSHEEQELDMITSILREESPVEEVLEHHHEIDMHATKFVDATSATPTKRMLAAAQMDIDSDMETPVEKWTAGKEQQNTDSAPATYSQASIDDLLDDEEIEKDMVLTNPNAVLSPASSHAGYDTDGTDGTDDYNDLMDTDSDASDESSLASRTPGISRRINKMALGRTRKSASKKAYKADISSRALLTGHSSNGSDSDDVGSDVGEGNMNDSPHHQRDAGGDNAEILVEDDDNSKEKEESTKDMETAPTKTVVQKEVEVRLLLEGSAVFINATHYYRPCNRWKKVPRKQSCGEGS